VAVVSQLRRERIVDVPVYGSIAAGFAETTEQQEEDTVSIDATTLGLGRNKGIFALKVRGDSMINAGIHDGDVAILENREPQAGAIVAALIDGETTLKRLVHQRGRYYLRAENPKFPDLIPLAELTVQGVLVALVRKYRN
jgi:repressor LexA